MHSAAARRRIRVPLLTAAFLVVLALPAVSAAPRVQADAKLPFAAVQTFARDVFIIQGSTLRHPDDTTAPNANLFNVAGVSLGLTWGDWQRATATGTAQSIGNGSAARTEVDLQLRGLIPGGVYSVFYGTLTPDSENPLCPHVERTLALTARDARQQPDASSFVAGAFGQADFKARVDGHPLDAQQVFYEVIYHLDGHTYGPLPNHGEANTQGPACHSSFGEDAMRQLVILQKP